MGFVSVSTWRRGFLCCTDMIRCCCPQEPGLCIGWLFIGCPGMLLFCSFFPLFFSFFLSMFFFLVFVLHWVSLHLLFCCVLFFLVFFFFGLHSVVVRGGNLKIKVAGG